MHNASLFTADRMAHLKIVVVSVLLASVVAGLGIAARVGEGSLDPSRQMEATVIKAGKPLTASAGNDRVVR
jgi:hypothetical protein